MAGGRAAHGRTAGELMTQHGASGAPIGHDRAARGRAVEGRAVEDRAVEDRASGEPMRAGG